MLVTVVRVELSKAMVDAMRARAGRGSSIGMVVTEKLRAVLPALARLKQSPLDRDRGSRPTIQLDAGQPAGLAALRRVAEATPPPARFYEPHQIAIPAELWRQVDAERVRLGMRVDDLIAWAWRQA